MNSAGGSNESSFMKGVAAVLLIAAIAFALCACAASAARAVPRNAGARTKSAPAAAPERPEPPQAVSHGERAGAAFTDGEKIGDASGEKTEETAVPELKMKIDGRELAVIWEDNESVGALTAYASDAPITIETSAYGGFEQVGPLGKSLPRSDAQTTAHAGDIVLYSGDQIVVLYGSNSWSYTRLGRIEGMSVSELEDVLGGGSVELLLFTE